MDINAKTFPVTNEELINSEYASGDVAFISAYVDDTGTVPKLFIPSDWPVFINTALVNKNQIDDIRSEKGRLLLSRNQFASLADNKQNLPETERMHHLQKAGMKNIWNNIVSIGTGCLPQIVHSSAETQHYLIQRGEKAPLYPLYLHEATGLASGHPIVDGLRETWEEIALVQDGKWLFPTIDDVDYNLLSGLPEKIVSEQRELVQERIMNKFGVDNEKLAIKFIDATKGALPEGRHTILNINFLNKKEESYNVFSYMDMTIRSFGIINPMLIELQSNSPVYAVDAENVFPGDHPDGRKVISGPMFDILARREKMIPQTRAYFESLQLAQK